MIKAVQTNTARIREQLRSVGMRITASRLAVLEAVYSGGHLPADTIATLAREHLGSLSRQAVYDNLHALLEAGLVRRIEPANAPALYEARVGDNHHHLVCTDCGRIEDVDCVVGHRPCLEPSATHGFLLTEAEVVFWGICPTCQNRVSSNPIVRNANIANETETNPNR
jgi:Fur family transcriptional regulator, stress-responsive regulator